MNKDELEREKKGEDRREGREIKEGEERKNSICLKPQQHLKLPTSISILVSSRSSFLIFLKSSLNPNSSFLYA
jgi:hypothetical protein